MPSGHLEDLVNDGACFAGFAAVGFGVGPDYPDLMAIPDLDTLSVLPWKKNIARFACNVFIEDGKGKIALNEITFGSSVFAGRPSSPADPWAHPGS